MLRSDVRRESGEARAPHAGDFAGVDKGLEQLFRTQHADGSWDKEAAADDELYGTTYTTALTVLALTPPYQILPIYQR